VEPAVVRPDPQQGGYLGMAEYELAPGESVVGTGRFRFGNIRFWMHWSLTLTTNRLLMTTPGTLFLIFPMGVQRTSYPLQNLTDVRFTQTYSIWSGILGCVLALFTLGLFEGATQPKPGALGVGLFLGFLFLFWTATCFFNVIQPRITIANNRGAGINGKVAISDRNAAREFLAQLSKVVAGYSVKVHMDPAFAAPAVAAPAPSAGATLADLVNLRDQGIITTEEYETKRREILARM
jgi:hypothetical protein